MIDGHYKAKIDLFWNRLAKLLSGFGLTPNMVTWLGLILVLLNCVLYFLHKNNLLFGILLAVSFTFDALDGAIARVSGRVSKYGGYLDAIVDRYQEVAIYFILAVVNGYWTVCFIAITGSLLVSYNKARTSVEIPIDNVKWPDITERLERIILICAALLLDPFIRMPERFNEDFLYYMILVIGILTHITAVQRFMRARNMILKPDHDLE